MQGNMYKVLATLLTLFIFCPHLGATPTHVELRGNDIPDDKHGVNISLEAAMCSTVLEARLTYHLGLELTPSVHTDAPPSLIAKIESKKPFFIKL